MRSKTPLVLMEMLVMVLVFALAAALCVQAFVQSDQLSRANEARDYAVRLSQSAAEALKAAGGDLAQAAGRLGADASRDALQLCYDADWTPADGGDWTYRLDARLTDAPAPGMGQAEISVCSADGGEPLFSLTVAWQEVSGDE